MHRLVVLAALVLALDARAVTIDWVLVGDPGNAADTSTNCRASNCGSVADPYLISKYEVTNAQYAEFLNAVYNSVFFYDSQMNSDPNGGISYVGSGFVVKPGFANKPVNYVSFNDAMRFANWLNNGQGNADTETGAYTITAAGIAGNTIVRNDSANIVLPTENEWYKAAYFNGTSYFDFPAGSSTPTACGAPGAVPNTANCNFFPRGVTDVGAYTNSASPYGTFDQGGNVGEWNEQTVTYGIVVDDVVVSIDRGRVFRGGSWETTGSALSALANNHWMFPHQGQSNIGFRVARLVPEPGTSLLMMIGLSGLGARSRSRK